MPSIVTRIYNTRSAARTKKCHAPTHEVIDSKKCSGNRQHNPLKRSRVGEDSTTGYMLTSPATQDDAQHEAKRRRINVLPPRFRANIRPKMTTSGALDARDTGMWNATEEPMITTHQVFIAPPSMRKSGLSPHTTRTTSPACPTSFSMAAPCTTTPPLPFIPFRWPRSRPVYGAPEIEGKVIIRIRIPEHMKEAHQKRPAA